ncbi:hypothetical protein D3C87_2080600 [compost metagenome]
MDLFAGLADLLQSGADPRHVPLPGIRQRDATRSAVKQTRLQAAFQPGDGVAHRSRGHAQLLRRTAKTAATHYRHHHFQLCQS